MIIGFNVCRLSAASPFELSGLAALGFVGAIIVRGDTIVDGVIRFEAAKRLGLDRIPCLSVDHLTEQEARQAALALNRIAELGAWRLDELKIELEVWIGVQRGTPGYYGLSV